MKKYTILLVSLLLLAAVVILRNNKQSSLGNSPTIAIIQTASHPSLDSARQSFIETIKQTQPDVQFVIHNAEGSVAQAQALAQRLHANKNINAFYTIATLATQAIATLEKERPIVYAAVSDISFLNNQSNVCGISDMIDANKTAQMIQQFLPQNKTIALLYNNGEINSISQVNLLKKALEKTSLHTIEIALAQESDIPVAVAMACRKADALLCPADNTLASAMKLIATLALDNNKLLFACYSQAVENGALAAYGVDYAMNGKQAAQAMIDILINKKNPQEISVIYDTLHTLYVNKKTLDTLGIKLPSSLSDKVVLLNNKES